MSDPTAAPAGEAPSEAAASGVEPTSTTAAPTAPTEPTASATAEADRAAEDAAEHAARKQRAAESETLAEQGIGFCKSARWRAAIEPLRRATELDPMNATAFYYLGDACNHADALPAALEAFEAAARLQPDHWRALKGVGIVLDRMRRPQEATAAYQRAREAQARSDAV